jgi:hypothetical protein
MKMILHSIAAAMWLATGLPASAESSAEPPLPPIEVVIQRVIDKAQTQSDDESAFKDSYYYTRTKVTEYRNGDGKVTKRETKQDAHDPERRRARLNSRRPEVVLNASTFVGKGPEPTETTSNVRGRAFEKKDFLMNPDLLNRFDFVLRGRESVGGRSLLVIDFKPKSGKLPERNLKDRFINRAAGRVWLDEEESQLVRADLHLTERVNVMGGLVGAVWKFTCSIDRERTDDGLWFTRQTSWHLEGREVFVRRTVDYHEATTDLRRAH